MKVIVILTATAEIILDVTLVHLNPPSLVILSVVMNLAPKLLQRMEVVVLLNFLAMKMKAIVIMTTNAKMILSVEQIIAQLDSTSLLIMTVAHQPLDFMLSSFFNKNFFFFFFPQVHLVSFDQYKNFFLFCVFTFWL